MVVVLIDTNVLVYAAKYKIDIFSEIRKKFGLAAIRIPTAVLTELENISKKAKKGADKQAAKLALQLIRAARITEIDIGDSAVDDAIVEWARRHDAVVITNDVGLKYKLKKAGVPVYCLRQKKLLEFWT